MEAGSQAKPPAGLDAKIEASKTVLICERQAGVLWRDEPKNRGERGQFGHAHDGRAHKTLAAHGIDTARAARMRLLAPVIPSQRRDQPSSTSALFHGRQTPRP
jgi:hypothetical protein